MSTASAPLARLSYISLKRRGWKAHYVLFRLGHIQHGTQKSTVYRYLCIDLDVTPVAVPTLGRVILSGPTAARLLRAAPRGRQRGAPTRRDEAARRPMGDARPGPAARPARRHGRADATPPRMRSLSRVGRSGALSSGPRIPYAYLSSYFMVYRLVVTV
jgi:hypothetical protein